MKKINEVTFAISLLIIASVSAIDAYLNLKYGVTAATEENPVAALILRISNDDLPLLISLKLFNTSLVLSFLVFYSFYKKMYAHLIAGFLAVVQIAVIIYIAS